MIPLSEQDPAKWDQALIRAGHAYLKHGFALQRSSARLLHAGIHALWCRRRSLVEPPPWPEVLALYDSLVAICDTPVVRTNRIVALSEVKGCAAALEELEKVRSADLVGFLPYHVTRADVLRRSGRAEEARHEYDRALALSPGAAEMAWLHRRRDELDRARRP